MPVRINKFPHDKERRELSCYIPRFLKKECHFFVTYEYYTFLFFLFFLKGFRRADPFRSYFSRTCVGSPPHLMSSSKLSGRASVHQLRSLQAAAAAAGHFSSIFFPRPPAASLKAEAIEGNGLKQMPLLVGQSKKDRVVYINAHRQATTTHF